MGVFDTKKPRSVAITTSSIDRSHHDPVYDVFWIQSKTNNQFVSVSTGVFGGGGQSNKASEDIMGPFLSALRWPNAVVGHEKAERAHGFAHP